MSNHVWECEHGVELGQGCTRICGRCSRESGEPLVTLRGWSPWGPYGEGANPPANEGAYARD